MRTPTITVNAKSATELAQICDLPVATLRNALAHVRATKDQIVSPKVLRTMLEVALDEEAASVLTRQLMGLGAWMRHTGVTAADVIERITFALRERWQRDQARLANWQAVAPIIQELLSDPHVAIAAKALELSFDFQNNYDNARILTDIRPIFDEGRDHIIGAIVGHRLRISYHDASTNFVTMTIAMEQNDLEQLQKACKDAINKAAVATELIEKKAALKPFVGGEDNDLS